MSEKALRVVATGDMFITRRIAEDGYEGFEELKDQLDYQFFVSKSMMLSSATWR